MSPSTRRTCSYWCRACISIHWWRRPSSSPRTQPRATWSTTGSRSASPRTVEAPPGFEPGYEGFAVPCLTNLATVPGDGASTAKFRRSSRRERQREEEAAVAALLALHPDAAAVGLDDAAGDREAEAGAVGGRAVLALEIAIEGARPVLRRGARD